MVVGDHGTLIEGKTLEGYARFFARKAQAAAGEAARSAVLKRLFADDRGLRGRTARGAYAPARGGVGGAVHDDLRGLCLLYGDELLRGDLRGGGGAVLLRRGGGVAIERAPGGIRPRLRRAHGARGLGRTRRPRGVGV